MSCRRAFDLDLAAFLESAAAPEWAEFRDHYPRCADCAGEVRAWTELRARLRDNGHPSEEVLLRFEEQPAALEAAERASIERHLAACLSCRDELLALRRFDFRVLERPAPARPRRGLGVVRRVVWHPAFAYAALVLLAVPVLVDRLASGPETASQDVLRKAEERGNEVAQERASSRSLREEPSSKAVPGAVGGEGRVAAAPAAAPPLRAESAARNAEKQAPTADEFARDKVVTLRTDEPVVARLAGAGEEFILRVPLQVPPSGTVEVRVRDAGGRRELRERVAQPAAGEVQVRIPAAWLSRGSYEAEVYRSDGAREHVFSFEVR